MTKRWHRRPEGSNWGDFGDDDQLGSLNLIDAECVMKAVRSVTDGLRFCLSLPLDYPGGNVVAPHRKPPRLAATTRSGVPYFNYSFRREGCCDIGCDDEVTLSTQYSTQWDSFAHIGQEFDLHGDGVPRPCFYNGYIGGEHIVAPELRSVDQAMPLGIDRFAAAPIQGRGVLLDVARHFGRAYRNVTLADVLQILDADGIAVERGDIVCLHTGFADEILKMNRLPDGDRLGTLCAAIDGRDTGFHDWLVEEGVAALVADNYAVERVGLQQEGADRVFVPLHQFCLFIRGIPLGELWFLTELAQWLHDRGRYEFLLTAPPLRLPGAVGSPVTPVATV
jgi:kynurenine formamidase